MSGDHATLMDGVYRRQRHFYDITRKYYLFGRDRLIEQLDLGPGMTTLEIGCGTGRNMIVAAERWPEARFFGLDISEQMLSTARRNAARRTLSHRIALRQADAAAFDPQALFGQAAFNRVFFSYTLSMIPDWRAALAQGFAALGPGGRALAVDFGDQAGLPGPFRAGLRQWLSLFHVEPRAQLREGFEQAAQAAGLMVETQALYGGYAWLMTASSSNHGSEIEAGGAGARRGAETIA